MFDDRGPIDHAWFILHVKNNVKKKLKNDIAVTPSPTRIGSRMTTIIVHGGAWDIPEKEHPAHLRGCDQAVTAGHEVLAGGGTSSTPWRPPYAAWRTIRRSTPDGAHS